MMDDVMFCADLVPGDHVVALSGELDLLSACSLWAALETLADNERLVLDCAALKFIDSSGLRVVLAQQQRRAAEGGSVVIRNPSPVMRRLLTVTGSTWLLEEEQPAAL